VHYIGPPTVFTSNNIGCPRDYLAQDDHESPEPRLAQIRGVVARDLDALPGAVDEKFRHDLHDGGGARKEANRPSKA